LLGHEFFAPQQWKRRLVLWSGAVLVALGGDPVCQGQHWAYQLFQLHPQPWRVDSADPDSDRVRPARLGHRGAFARHPRQRYSAGDRHLHIEDEGFRARMLALPIAAARWR
jgi:hypothetical protein